MNIDNKKRITFNVKGDDFLRGDTINSNFLNPSENLSPTTIRKTLRIKDQTIIRDGENKTISSRKHLAEQKEEKIND